jgi:hypothetical protein
VAIAAGPDLSARLRSLIERDFADNLNRAARAWGVPQPTLYRYVQRGTRAPNARTLLRIARFYDTTVEWLVDGVGRGPVEPEYPVHEFRGWNNLVRQLRLPESAERLVLALPGRIGVANFVLCDWGLFPWKGKQVSQKRQEPAWRAKWLASALELEAWTVWLRALITTYGRTAVRDKLVSELDRVRLGFQRFAIFLYSTDRLPADLGAIYDREFHPPGQPVGSIHLNQPQQPPLNAVRGTHASDSPDPPKGRQRRLNRQP